MIPSTGFPQIYKFSGSEYKFITTIDFTCGSKKGIYGVYIGQPGNTIVFAEKYEEYLYFSYHVYPSYLRLHTRLHVTPYFKIAKIIYKQMGIKV